MPTIKERLVVSEFRSPIHEALLGLLVASSHMRSTIDNLMGEYGISTEQYNILRILRGVYPNAHSCGEVSRRMIDRSPDITRRIDTMEAAGLVSRSKSDEDKRIVMIMITEKGRDLLKQIDPVLEELEANIGKRFSAEECEQFTDMCSRFLAED
jgi:DNA-binding MarR family transcriptional regulator